MSVFVPTCEEESTRTVKKICTFIHACQFERLYFPSVIRRGLDFQSIKKIN